MSLPQPQNVPNQEPVQDPRSSERVFSGLFRESPVPMLLVDARSRRVARVNQAFAAFLGSEPTALEGAALRSLDTGDGAELEEYLLLALACGDQAPRRRQWQTGSGEIIPVEIRSARLHADQGTLLALYVQDLRGNPEDQEPDRNSGNPHVLLARKHEAVSRLALGFAREFDTLLDRIGDAAKEVEEGSFRAPRVVQGVESLRESAEQARTLVRELLAFTGQQKLAPRTVEANDVVASCEGALRDTLPQDIGIMVRLCDQDTQVQVDPAQLEDVVVQLVGHARRAMPDGGYVVVATDRVILDEDFVRDHPSSRTGPHVVLSVTDTGAGLDEEAQSRIFEPFYRTGHTAADGGDEGGMGLATVYGIVKQSGGTIWVTSRPEVGTTFRVYLPQTTDDPRTS